MLLSSLGTLARLGVSAEQVAALDVLRREIEPQSKVADPMAVADREEAIADRLTDHGVDRDRLIAPPLAGAGVSSWAGMEENITIDSVPGETVLRVPSHASPGDHLVRPPIDDTQPAAEPCGGALAG